MCTVQTITNQIQYLNCFKMPANLVAFLQELEVTMVLKTWAWPE